MGVPYRWFLSPSFTRDRVLELVRAVPNEGLTERFDGEWVDVYRAESGEVTVEAADVEAFAGELEREGRGTLSYDVASALELARCIALEGASSPGAPPVFDGYRCVDLARTLARAEGLLDDGFDDGADGAMLAALCKSLERALELHIAVMFGE